MAFELKQTVPWGRNFHEYAKMFQLTKEDLGKKIAGFGDGPASFNYQSYCMGYDVTSYDVVYQFGREELEQRIEEVRETVMQQMRENADDYVWTNIKSLEELEQIRMTAMKLFLEDYDFGKREGRYVFHELPKTLPVADSVYDIGLSSHFLLLYTLLGYDFHIQAMEEMLRVCKEIRIFPIVDLAGKQSELTEAVIAYFKRDYLVEIKETDYEFQKGANKMLLIKKQGE